MRAKIRTLKRHRSLRGYNCMPYAWPAYMPYAWPAYMPYAWPAYMPYALDHFSSLNGLT